MVVIAAMINLSDFIELYVHFVTSDYNCNMANFRTNPSSFTHFPLSLCVVIKLDMFFPVLEHLQAVQLKSFLLTVATFCQGK